MPECVKGVSRVRERYTALHGKDDDDDDVSSGCSPLPLVVYCYVRWRVRALVVVGLHTYSTVRVTLLN